MVTEPDYGSDVAGVKVDRDPDRRRLARQRREDVGDVRRPRRRAHAARAHRPRPSRRRTAACRCSIVEKPRAEGHAFAFDDGRGGKMEGRAIDTIGYRGMHSYEVAFDNWFVPGREPRSAARPASAAASTSRWRASRTAGCRPRRAPSGSCRPRSRPGSAYAQERKVFGSPVFDYQLSKVKLARMAALIQAGRQFSYDVARKMAAGEGTLEASMVKAYVCRAAEWVTREAMQLHGGMGYAEEFPVSRFFVDARVLSIFEGADETLCLRVIARRLAEHALALVLDGRRPEPVTAAVCCRGVAGDRRADEWATPGRFTVDE